MDKTLAEALHLITCLLIEGWQVERYSATRDPRRLGTFEGYVKTLPGNETVVTIAFRLKEEAERNG